MTTTLGIVIDGFGVSHEPVLEFLSRARSQFSVVINEKEKLANPAQAFTQVFFRDVNDDDLFNRENFDAYTWTTALASGLADGVGLYLGNEPGDGDFRRLIDNTCNGMLACIDMRRPAALFNFPVWHPPMTFYTELINHERFNSLFRVGNFWICFHDYFSVGFKESLEEGAILRPIWYHLQQEYGRILCTELGAANGYNPHAGWKTYLSEDDYLAELKLWQYNSPFPATVFCWQRWNGFEIQDARQLQDFMVQLNNQAGDEDMYYLTHPFSKWNVRSAASTNARIVGSIDISKTPVKLLSLTNGWYNVFIPALDITGYIYQSGIASLGSVGFRKAE